MSKYKNKTSTKDGHTFKSKLERTCYDLLKKEELEFNYEDKKFVLIPTTKCTFDSYERVRRKGKNTYTLKSRTVPKISYRPDFVGDGWIIETKGYETAAFRLKWKMFKKYLEDNNLKYVLFKPHNKTEIIKSINIIKSLTNDKDKTKSSRLTKVS